MTQPLASKLPKALQRKAGAARRSLWIERILRAYWPLWVIACIAGAVWFLGIFESAPGMWPTIVAAVLGVCALISLIVGSMRLRAPTRGEVLRSLDEGLVNRAASMLDEDIAVGDTDDDARRMWQAHRERLMRDVEGAKVPAPNTRLSAFDGWGLRYIALFGLIIAAAYSRIGGGDRVAALLNPAPAVVEAAALTPALEAWVAPPPYTGVAPVYMTEKSGDALAVPTGSVVTLRASGVSAIPTITGVETPFVEDAVGVFGATLTITEDTDLAVLYAEDSLGDWSLAVIPDNPPQIGVSTPPAATATRALGFSFTAEDDYGVVAARAKIVADRSGMETPPDRIEEPIEMELTPPAALADEVIEQSVEQDFAEHPWVGSPVIMTLFAEDAAGHVTESDPVKFILPGRVFTEPMARALIEQRRDLAWDYRVAWDALDMIEAFTDYPDDYFTDPTAFLATSTAKKRLTYAVNEDRFIEERTDILELLWSAALRLEEGDLDNALEQLRAAQRRLKDALERGASDEELEQLMAELRDKMNEYLDEMARQAMRDQQNGQQPQQGQQQQNQQAMTREDLEKLLDQMEQMAKDGSREEAEQMLSALSEMLENLQMSQGQQGEGQGGQQEQALQDMMRRQQELADETFQDLQNGENGQQQQGQNGQQGQEGQQGQQGQAGQQGQGQQGQGQGQQGQGQGGRQGQQGQGRDPGQGQGQGQGERLGQGQGGQGREGGQSGRGGQGTLRGRQEGLRGELDGMLGGMDAPGARDALGDAEREMGNARDSIGNGDLNEAIDRQARALDRLREGAQALAEEAARNAQEGEGNPNGRQDGAETGANSEQFDPFGRLSRTVGPDDGDGVEVPGERARNRALEIQREIRRRQSERNRSEQERKYLDRLQKRF